MHWFMSIYAALIKPLSVSNFFLELHLKILLKVVLFSIKRFTYQFILRAGKQDFGIKAFVIFCFN